MSALTSKRCVPCAPGTPPLSKAAQDELSQQVPDWRVVDGTRIRREYKFKTYLDGAAWVPSIGAIADAEDHHPDIHLYYRKVVVELWTHTVNGLSENDYILAAKFDEHFKDYPGKR